MDATLVSELRATVDPGYVHDQPSEIIAYSYDGTFQQRRPDLAISPASTDEVAAIVRIAAQHKLPIIARGASSGLAGGTIPESGGLILNLARMDRILEIDKGNVCVVAQAGVVTLQLQQAVEQAGLFYPPDPASSRQSTIGGNVATNAGGPRCLKYGVTRDYVIGLTVVLASGEVLRLGGKVTKNATGYQLMQLFVGSEGTLGIVTEVTLKLAPLPRARVTAVATFPRLASASEAVARIMASGILPATLELMDGTTINVVEDFLHAGLPRQAEALLLLEQDGGDEAVARGEVERMAEICRSLGAAEVTVAGSAAERDRLWAARRAVSAALGRLRPNKLGEDIVVPKTAIPEMIAAVRDIAARYALPIPVFGHAGDGNLHPNILFDLRDPDEVRRVECAARDIFRAAIRLGGTLSGEHGIGTLKREFLEEAQGSLAVRLSRSIKRAFDPDGLLNPGKVFPTGRGTDAFLADLPTLAGATPGVSGQPPGRLAGKVAIVTGAGSRAPCIGNGRAAAILFAREGARIVLVDRVAEWAEQTLGMIADERGQAGVEAIVVEADVTRAEDCQRIVDETVRRFGRIDILHNNVGIGGSGTVVDLDVEDWDRMMQVNVKSMMLMARHVIPVMAANGGGSITNVSSISSIRPRGLTAYTTSKGAVNALTIAMAIDHAAQGIRVNCILPGPVYTPGVASGGMTDEQRAARAHASPLGTEGTAWDVGWAAVYLASPEARWVTGQLLCVDGGVTLMSPSRGVGEEPKR